MAVTTRAQRAIAALTALTLGSALLGTAAHAAPSEEEIAASRAAESSTSSRIASLEIELAQVAAQADEASVRAQVANEEVLQSQVELDAAVEAAEQAQAEADAAAADLEVARQELGQIGAALYRDGSASLSQITPYLSADSFADAMARSSTLNRLGGRAESQVQRFDALEQIFTTLQRRADDAVATQASATEALADAADSAEQAFSAAETQLRLSTERREQLIGQLAEQRSTTVELERERQAALDAERRQRQEVVARNEALAAAADARPAAAPSASASGDGGQSAAPTSPAPTSPAPTSPAPAAPTPSTPPPAPAPTTPAPAPAPTTPAPAPAPTTPAPTTPPPAPKPQPAPAPPVKSGTAQTAIAWARTQIGKPYVYGAAGPNSYDCSGLTMRAFQQAGVNLPRTSRAQYAATARVPLNQLQPGDLVFWSNNGAASGIYHVAIYTGGGMRLHAPNPSVPVQEAGMIYAGIMPFGGRV